MGKRKPPLSEGPQPGQVRRGRAREKQRLAHTANADYKEEKKISNVSENSNLGDQKHVISSGSTLEDNREENIGNLLQTSKIVLPDKRNECTSPSDCTLSQPRRPGRTKRRRRNKLVGMSLKDGIDTCEHNPSLHSTVVVGLVSKNGGTTSADHNLSPLVKDITCLKGVEGDLVKSDISFGIDSNSYEVTTKRSKRSKRRERKRKRDFAFAGFAEVASDLLQVAPTVTYANMSSSVAIADSELANKNKNEASRGDHLLLPANEDGLLKGADADTSKNVASLEINSNRSKASKRRKRKRRRDFAFSSSAEVASDLLQVAPTVTYANMSSSVEFADSELANKNKNDASRGDHLLLPANEDGLLKDADADTSKNVASLEINSKLTDVKNMKPRKQRRQRKRGKDKLSQTNTVPCSTQQVLQCATHADSSALVGIAENELERKNNVETCINNNLVPPGEKKSSAIAEGASASAIIKHMMPEDGSSDDALLQKNGDCLISLSPNNLEPMLPKGLIGSCSRKKLLVLDLNGVLCDVVKRYHGSHHEHRKVGMSTALKRPFCDDFLKFCWERFEVGVWSSRNKMNVHRVVSSIMGDIAHNLSFCWDGSKCTITGFNTIEQSHKPLVLKELRKLWDKEEADLPWEKGDYSPSNTLLIDDSPYKALCNPPHTGIFPYPYQFRHKNDNSLGPGGDLRVYLEGLAMADDVQRYVREHPFGQHAITTASASWKFYERIVNKFKASAASS